MLDNEFYSDLDDLDNVSNDPRVSIEKAINDAIISMDTFIVARITKVNDDGTCDVQPVIKTAFLDENGNIEKYDRPIITNLKVATLNTKSVYISLKLQVDDTVLILVLDRNIDNWFVSGENSEPNSITARSIDDAVILPFMLTEQSLNQSSNNPNQDSDVIIKTVDSSSSVSITTNDESKYIKFDGAGNIDILANNFNVSANTVNIQATSGSASFTGSNGKSNTNIGGSSYGSHKHNVSGISTGTATVTSQGVN